MTGLANHQEATMGRDSLTALGDPALLQARDAWFVWLRELFSGEKPERAFALQGIQKYTEDDSPDWRGWRDKSLDELAAQAEKSLDQDVFRPLCINYNPHGVHFVDLFVWRGCVHVRWWVANAQHQFPQEQLQCILPSTRCQPPGFGQLCGCTSHLIFRKHYAEFIAPLDETLLSLYPHGGMVHLCGSHTQHIPFWREAKCLRAIQLNDRAAEDLEIYFNDLREDQVIYVNPSEGMPMRRILAVTGGHRLVIIDDVEEPRSLTIANSTTRSVHVAN